MLYYNSTIIIAMPAKSQRGIRRPRRSGADLELRQGILSALKDLQKDKPLSKVADALEISEKNLRRYMNDKLNPPPTLGGDILYRLCEAGYAVACRGQTLQCVASASKSKPRGKPEQLQFEFVGTIDVLLPSRKLVARVERVYRRTESKRA
jgi:hypothetical protein